RRGAARRRAEGYGWQPAVEAFLAAHDAPVALGRPAAAPVPPHPAGPRSAR
ncbi:glycosyltransferase family 1 protein, partial [Streptomyces lydicus]